MLTVRDIPTIQGLKDVQIRAGQQYADNHIRWPYIAEEYQLDPWLKGGEVVFITGINRHWSEDDLAKLVDVLKHKDAAALVVLTGSKHIPKLQNSWLALCEEKQLPLLEQPYSLPMVTVTERISNAIVQDTFAQRSKQWFIQQLIDSRIPPETITLEQAKQIGFPIDLNLSVAMIIPSGEHSTDLEAWYFALCEYLSQRQSPFPVIEYRNGWILCLPQPTTDKHPCSIENWEKLHRYLQTHNLMCSIGVSDGYQIAELSRMFQKQDNLPYLPHKIFRDKFITIKHSGFNVYLLQ